MMSLKERQKLGGMKSAELLKKQKTQRIEEYDKNPKLCIQCNSPITYEKRRNKYCSHSCSAIVSNKQRAENGWNHSEHTLKKLREHGLVYGKLAKPPASQKIKKTCEYCKSEFFVIPSKSKFRWCSKVCMISDPDRYKNYGGYRRGSGYSKSGYYKGIYCQSTYELCWVIWALDNGIKFSRFDYTLKNETVKYVPDFILDDGITIVELKGYEDVESVNKKTKLAESFGYVVNVLYKEDLQSIFEYVTNKFGTTDYKTLYDDYKPKYDYVCSFCDKQFSSESKKITKIKFCSRSCCGKYRSNILHESIG